TNKKGTEKGKIVLATVKGDIHDIGKNIVKVILENYGYEIIDLGKDVKIERVLEEAINNDVKLVGLSALMTTTIKSMEETIKALKDNNFKGKIMVGGAVLTKEYAKNIGADFYSKDAKESVEIARKVFN
ncbi:MAG: cobalamin-dependent protein, partial [Clostridium sp.]